MRMRFKPYARPELLATPWHAHEPLENKGHWRSLFARPQQPFHLELGCGKGGYLSKLASAHPEVNYLGVDITDKVLILAKRKIEKEYAEKGLPVDNVLIASFDIERIAGVMDERDQVQRIYINFCNPWNRKLAHKKHRLTHTRQLALYRAMLADGGEVYFKTDDEGLFNDSLAYFPEAGFEITWQTRDLHADEPAWNIRTEHEAMFTEQGIKTKALIARKLPLENEQQALAEAIAKRTAIEKAESAAWRAEHGEG
ncbi:MAG TPA: tRNA (guanosine(46)-N7)-methyltransferase TrmB [Candidatus Fournierella merdipullorum]|uniref:tRNA (guanine-N(7)-)-methyltransferase n=1 Tax=Candidatus Allofournierella merdipullorum TaxID=2838595 RepID=A0A9D2E4Q7_9FIRM|nr:tRNA (guanosine(46)-N7)-methyltransferase TrmB [Candidatus Fournierella merdipullorum]